ncbi:Nucleolar pre-ribosomal-associated protein 1 [Myotis brandtii]|uniref:Nucleolar pre-ribosomal-associated protein 1 n=1 Tax=Myotis brandtii TaxID=109478 RepID=S7MIP5_MYOBR|nr:Nucleolar pre-ribosomal-associated protein 1 [Myotis brandtii]
MRDKHCYELYARRGVFHVVLSFFSSPLCDPAAQGWVLEILQNAARDARAAYELLRDYSLLTWVLHALEGRFLETQLLSSIIDLLHTLWVTNLGGRGVEAGSPPGTQKPPKLLALHLVNEFLYVLLALAKHLSHRSAASAAFLLSLYVQDVWLGVRRPDTLLAHVQMVREAAEDTPGGDQEAIVGLCEDIAALAPDT